MKNSYEFIIGLSLFATLFSGLVAYLMYRQERSQSYLHLIEFWASVFVLNVFHFLLPKYAVAIVLGWIWPLRTITLLLEGLSNQKILGRWHLATVGAGLLLSLFFIGTEESFLISALPFTIAISAVGAHISYEAYNKISPRPIRNLCILFGLFFLSRSIFLRGPEIYLLDCLFAMAFSSLVLPAFLLFHQKHHENRMDEILKDRSDKFFGQSKFSELGMMSAGIAHEINNPLAVIQARTTQLLRIYRNQEKQKEVADGLQQILFTSERINKTIQGVREFVHHDENAPAQEIVLKDLIDDVLAFCGQRMKNHGVNLRFYGLEDFTVVGNKIQLEQIILNLLNNSFDAIEFLQDKWIEVSCHEKNGRIQLFFKDSGSGIPKEIADRMMEPFFSTKDVGKGTGLGLALAQGIAEKHGGTLRYLSDCNHTTFKLELPKSKDDWNIPLH